MQTDTGLVDDPEPFSVERYGDRPVIVLHVPHAGMSIPADARRRIVLDDRDLLGELAAMTDRHTDRIAAEAVRRGGVDAVLFVNRLSRLVVDPERFPDDREPMNAIGMGAVYHRTSIGATLRHPDPTNDAAMRDRWFHPYAEAFADLVDEILAVSGAAIIIDLHSYAQRPLPYEPDPRAPRPGVCIGVDEVHTPDDLVRLMLATWDRMPGGAAINTPFAGSYVPLRHYGSDVRVRSVMVEVRRDLYLDELTGELHDGFDEVVDRLAAALTMLAQ
jgi:N-formylglutamate amidohydrolase